MDNKLLAVAAIAVASIALNVLTIVGLNDVRESIPESNFFVIDDLDQRVRQLGIDVDELKDESRDQAIERTFASLGGQGADRKIQLLEAQINELDARVSSNEDDLARFKGDLCIATNGSMCL